ncbi:MULTISPECIES: hypothetical protein [Burkholderia]|uniref:hypothetical protein n=1 Tax=Burkholderia TaxID=32008 RepID=UPI0005724817|nr:MULTISPECIES: hypothetical protein [Burkholderia]MCT7922349.1 hypothetical protein [Burkholderia pseudomallei]PNW98753.1 hypothetical protein CF649_25780 [Burkholderia sp. 136(2017)]PNX14563.1 hypothetical protein CF650_14630 [Burkholderia sp. 129]PNX25137.1 hypothetical protein CF647_32090 [Burkholderia sp. 117]PNX35143.1 hypothetical protein CF648_25785 [Burkholderia sp. 137]
MSGENFLDSRFPVFSERVSDAAADDSLVRAGPLLNRLERAYAVVHGLEQIFAIARANLVQESLYRNAGEGCEVEPPLKPTTVEALLAMGAAVSGLLVQDIGALSDWADEHAVRPARSDTAA